MTRFAFLILASIDALAQSAILPCTRDASLSRAGPRTELRLERSVLLDFQFSVIQGWRIQRAQLLLHLAAGSAPDRIGIATATADWSEVQPRLNLSRLKFLSHRVEPHENEWIRIDVAPSLIELLASGKGHGLVLRDSAGRGRVIHARESGQHAPYLVVDGSPR